jgi:hypothetical protein
MDWATRPTPQPPSIRARNAARLASNGSTSDKGWLGTNTQAAVYAIQIPALTRVHRGTNLPSGNRRKNRTARSRPAPCTTFASGHQPLGRSNASAVGVTHTAYITNVVANRSGVHSRVLRQTIIEDITVNAKTNRTSRVMAPTA